MQFKPSKLWASLILGNALLVAAGAAHSQVYQLDQMTVLGQGQETEVFTNPASVTVIDRDTINKSAGQSVASYLRNVPGVQVVEDGLERISIRGESSTRVAIFIDGQKLTDHTEHGQPLLIDPASIERIEVLRGSSSVVSGGRAIGGVVNIVTKKGADKLLEISTQAGYFSATKGYRASTALSGSQAGFDYRLGVSRSELNDRSTPKGRLKPSSTDDSNISAHLGYKTGKHYIAAKAQRYDVAAEMYWKQDGFATDLPKRELNKVGLFYEGEQLTETLDKLKINVYRQTIDREFHNVFNPSSSLNVDSLSDDEQITYGLNTQAELSLIDGHSTVIGAEYEQDRLKTKKDKTTTIATPIAVLVKPENGYDDASIDTTSVYAQHTVPLTDDLTASFGARHYYVKAKHDKSLKNNDPQARSDNSDNHTVGAMSLVWQASDDLVLRTNLSQGYVYPTLTQLFLTTNAGGTKVGYADLKPEKSTTFELGARYDTNALLLDATLFYSRSKDYIDAVSIDSSSDRHYRNADKAKSYGVELLAEKSFENSNFKPYTTATLMRRKITITKPDSKDRYKGYDSGVPSVFARVGLKYSSHWNAWEREADLFVQGATSALNVSEKPTNETYQADGYATLNLRLSMTTRGSNSFGIELNNLTDKTYRPIDEQLYGAKRSVNVFASYTF